MSGTTIVSVGSTSVSTSGALTGQLLKQFTASLAATNAVTVASASAVGTVSNPITFASGPGAANNGNNTLIIPSSDSGDISVPSGYQFIIYQGSGTLLGANSTQVIIGDLDYSGGAGTVLSTGSVGGTVADSAPGALLSFAGGTNVVSATGAGQTVQLDGGTNDVLALAATQMIIQSGGASTINSSGANAGSATAVASAGSMAFFGFGAGNDVVSVSGSTSLLFQGIGGTDTIFGGGGSDTVIAGQAVYMGGSGSNLFVGGAGTSTLYGAAQETIYGGTGGGVFSLGANSSDFFVAHGGADSTAMASDSVVLGAKNVGDQVWGNSNENLTIGAAASATGAVVVGFGTNDSINMTNSAGNDTVVLWNVDFGANPFTGNTTLTGASAGGDVFVMFGSLFGFASEGAHTVVINNWQSSDFLDLSAGYTTGDVTTAQAGTNAGGVFSFTLSDGTTVQIHGTVAANQIIHA